MAFIIIGDSFTFPEGNAATNRVYTYSKGLIEHGINVHVICFRSDYLIKHSGEIEGIKYYHPFAQTERNPHFIVRRWLNLQKFNNTIKLLRVISSEDKKHQITVYTTRLTTHLFAWSLSRIFKIKLIRECSEHPLSLYQKNAITRMIGYAKFKIETSLCDGIFCISQFLIDYYKSNGFIEGKLLLIPSTVDPARFSMVEKSPLPYSYIGYFGALTFQRDNVDILIKAYSRISDEHPELYLVLGGPCTPYEKKQIEGLTRDLKISSKVTLLEYMSRNEITRYIVGSHILVMVRSKNMESQASFPSKLTEYLATSRPLIAVNVGEVSDYLIDGVNSFLVEPGDYNKLADKLDYVINNYELALKIAERGKQLTETTFNYSYQAGRIMRFVNTL